MPLTLSEKERVRYHLGYTNVQPAASIQFGIPRPIQTMFLVDSAMSNLLEESVDRVRKILNVMDRIEDVLAEGAIERLAAIRLDEMELREDEPDKLDKEYQRWGKRLADLLGAPIYPYSARYQSMLGGVGSIPVRR